MQDCLEKLIKEDNSMKAAVTTKYGPPDVLQIKEMAKPIPIFGNYFVDMKGVLIGN